MAKVINILNSGGGNNITVVANYSALPSPASAIGEFYWASASQGTSWLPGSLGGTYYNSGLYYSNGVSWEFMNVPYQATQAEVNTGTNTDKFVTPSTLKNSTQFQFVDFTSSGQTQLNNRTANAVKRAGATTPVTGTTVETLVSSDQITGGFFSTNDIMQLVTARFIKTGALGTCTYRIRINTVNSLSGAVTIATFTNAGIYAKIGNRTFTITGGNLRGFSFTDNGISSGQDTGSASLAEASTAYNPANNIFVLTTAQLANGGDSTILRELLITN